MTNIPKLAKFYNHSFVIASRRLCSLAATLAPRASAVSNLNFNVGIASGKNKNALAMTMAE